MAKFKIKNTENGKFLKAHKTCYDSVIHNHPINPVETDYNNSLTFHSETDCEQVLKELNDYNNVYIKVVIE